MAKKRDAADQEELSRLIEIVSADTDDKTRQAELIAHISRVSGAVIKIVRAIKG